MAHLILDGVTIPVESISESPQETGKRERAFNGSYILSRQNTKRKWSVKTPWMQPTEAEMVRGIVQGAGQNFSLEQGVPYSTKGWASVADASSVILSNIAADGDNVVTADSDSPSYFGRYGLSHYNAGVENLFPEATRDAEGTTAAYTAVASSLAMDATHKWQGSQSVKCTFAGAGYSEINAAATVSGVNNDVFWGGVYLKAAVGGLALAVRLYDVDNAIGGAILVPTLTDADTWYRVTPKITLGGASSNIILQIFKSVSASEVVYCDGFSLEESPIAGEWYDVAGATATPPAMSLYYGNDATPLGNDLSIEAWVYRPDQGLLNTTPRAILAIRDLDAGSSVLSVYASPGTSQGLIFKTWATAGGSSHLSIYGDDTIWASGWHHVVCVMSHNPDTGRNNKEMYFDGASVASGDTAYLPELVNQSSIALSLLSAGTAGIAPLHGIVDQLRVLPYALTATAVAALYASSAGAGETPIIIASGDGISSTYASVIGQAMAVPQISTGSGFRRSVQFELNEV